jgi:methylenetetrahydrofolate reductase (NADPH)
VIGAGSSVVSLALMSRTVRDLLAQGDKSFSFEFFPPKTDAGERLLWNALAELEPLRPTFVSVTYGAGGSTRDRTISITGRIAEQTSMVPVGHLTCVGATNAELRAVIAAYGEAGVDNILALRGDPEGGPGGEWVAHEGGLNYASELVSLVHDVGPDFCVGVAAFPDPHPASDSSDVDAQVLLAKELAGADFAVTQFFFKNDAYFRLVERATALGITIPIIPGIMPVTNLAQIQRFAALSGTPFPADLAARFEGAVDADAVRRIGVELACEMSQELLDSGAPGLHFFTLNRSTATREIYAQLGLPAAVS